MNFAIFSVNINLMSGVYGHDTNEYFPIVLNKNISIIGMKLEAKKMWMSSIKLEKIE